jgi:acetolactate synthase-1/2/3 large subunit
VRFVFSVPGESFLAVLDAFYNEKDVKLMTCRHESGATFMAESYGKLTKTPGVAMVTRGPGATNASIGVHTAFHDATPLVLFIGQIPRPHKEREAFQEMDLVSFFRPTTKWAAEIPTAERIPEFVARAFHEAMSDRPGPVVLVLPEDMLREEADVEILPLPCPQESCPNPVALQKAHALLANARKPLLILGGSTWENEALKRVEAFAKRWYMPVATSFRRQDLFDNYSEVYAGPLGIGANPKLAQRVQDADLIFALGTRLDDVTTNHYTLIKAPVPQQKLLHVHCSAKELGKIYSAEVAIHSGLNTLASALQDWAAPDHIPWRDWCADAHADYLADLLPAPMPGHLDLGEAMVFLRDVLPKESIITIGAGSFMGWPQRYYRYALPKTQIGPVVGAMGYGVPAAIAAKLLYPDRPVIAFSGDGCFLMTGQELATAVRYQLPIIFMVINNNMYGTIRLHQEKHYPGRTVGTDLYNPDFAMFAQAFGASGEVIENTAAFMPAFQRALRAKGPYLLELRIPKEAITPRVSLEKIARTTSGD